MDEADSELIAEIEAFRADLRRRAEEHDRRARHPDPLDLPTIDVSRLEMAQIRALISQRYGEARYERRLRDVEERLAKLEAGRG